MPEQQPSTDTELIPLVDEEAKRRISQRAAIRIADLRITRRLPKFLRKLEELAEGVLVMKSNRKGEPAVYTQPPDRAALEYLVDRAMGRTPQRFELTGEDGGPMEVIPWAPMPGGEVVEGEVVGRDGSAEAEA